MSERSLVIGRFQPLHNGHKALIQYLLDEGKDVLVAVRMTPQNEDNPYSFIERTTMFKFAFPDEVDDGRIMIIPLPDISEVVYGRKVGWGIRQIELSAEIESISGTRIRNDLLDNRKQR